MLFRRIISFINAFKSAEFSNNELPFAINLKMISTRWVFCYIFIENKSMPHKNKVFFPPGSRSEAK